MRKATPPSCTCSGLLRAPHLYGPGFFYLGNSPVTFDNPSLVCCMVRRVLLCFPSTLILFAGHHMRRHLHRYHFTLSTHCSLG